jgi:histidine ammonia-lyase
MRMLMVAGKGLGIEELALVAEQRAVVQLTAEARGRMASSRRALEEVVRRGKVTYGVNTGVGEFRTVVISEDKLAELQRNLLRSSACGVGPELPQAVVRAMMLLRANAFATGESGVRPELVDILVEMLNRGVHPIVPRQGSVGSSGDLAPLAHISLVIIGEGEAHYQGERLGGREALKRAGLAPLELRAKEGLALINGTQLMTSIGALSLRRSLLLLKAAQLAVAMSVEALKGTVRAFDERLFQARPHPGAQVVAANLRHLLAESEIMRSHANLLHEVQDAYTLRCAPQVLGAARDALVSARGVLEVEMNSATDNPLVFGDGEVISGGNFHGMPVALALDQMALAVHVVGNFAERRIARLVDGKLSHLPSSLTVAKGLESGMMIPQYVAAALASENKLLSSPASADSIPTSANQEDFNSMGSVGALRLMEMVRNTETIVAIELMCAAQGLEFAKFRPGRGVFAGYSFLRTMVRPLVEDRSMSADIESIRRSIEEGSLVESVERECEMS